MQYLDSLLLPLTFSAEERASNENLSMSGLSEAACGAARQTSSWPLRVGWSITSTKTQACVCSSSGSL